MTAVVESSPTPLVILLQTEIIAKPTAEPTPVPTQTSLPIPTPTATPTPLPPIFSYSILGEINMEDGSPIAIVIRKGEMVIKSTWASAVSYRDGDVIEEVFSPYAGTVYSHIDGGFLATWIHSGRLKKADLFAWELEKAVWMNKWGGIVTLAEGHELANQLIGSVVTFCQADGSSFMPEPLSTYDPEAPCPGPTVEFVITAATLIERENVDAYELAVGDVVEWIVDNEVGIGFDQLVPGVSYLLQTCVGKFSDQVSDGTKDYLYNRLVLGLTVRE
jgi:hypothetical protein